MKQSFENLIKELFEEADGYIGFDANDIETTENCLIVSDYVLAEYKDKLKPIEMNDSRIFNTVGIVVHIGDKNIIFTDSKQDNDVDYREIYFSDSFDGLEVVNE